jgi:biopolymer transport protein ExbB/TolQ
VAAFLIGLPLAAGILSLLHESDNKDLQRYVHHDVENVEVVLFCCALGAILAKFWGIRTEKAACRMEVLPRWDGQPVPVAGAEELFGSLQQLKRRFQKTYLVRRVAAVLDFVRSRKSADDLDDQLRTLADNDALALEGSYALIRLITWAIPILGFLGTVLGITGAIAGVTPKQLEHDLSKVTDGLSLAFDATALALGLTMVTMFLNFLIDRAEQGVLEAVDRYADQELAHRFERTGAAGGEFAEVVKQHTQIVIQVTEKLIRKQAEVWAHSLAEIEKQRAEVEQRQQKLILSSLEAMLERTLETHIKRLAGLEKQVVEQSAGLLEQLGSFAAAVREAGREQEAHLSNVTQSVAAQAEALAHLQGTEAQLVKAQEMLAQNLNLLAGTGNFDQAVHSLTAAIHMLTSRSVTLPATGTSRLGQRPAA